MEVLSTKTRLREEQIQGGNEINFGNGKFEIPVRHSSRYIELYIKQELTGKVWVANKIWELTANKQYFGLESGWDHEGNECKQKRRSSKTDPLGYSKFQRQQKTKMELPGKEEEKSVMCWKPNVKK